MARVDELLSRLPAAATDRHREIITTAFGIANTVKSNAAGIHADNRYAPAYKNDQIRSMVRDAPIGHLKQLKGKVYHDRREVEERLQKLQPVPPDRADVYGEMQRSEVRTWLRNLKEGDRIALLMTTKDPEIISAVLNAPAFLSGTTPEVAAEIRTNLVERTSGPEIRELNLAAEALDVAQAAVDIAAQEIRTEAGFQLHEFTEMLK